MAATYVKPGELGLNPEKLTEMLTELEQTVEIHSISVRFDGKVILEGAWEPFSLEKPQMLHSLSKIGTSICLGFALDEGKIHLEDKLLDYVRDELPEEYDPALKRWSLETLPFIPQEFKYEVIPAVSKQFRIVSGLLNRTDVDTIYVCTDSGREGEYIYRLVEQQAGVKDKNRRRVWIDSQTEEEILRGIKEAKDLKEYDNLAASAYLRAKEDYLMGINFSRLLTLKYGNSISNYLNTKYSVVSVGRVMTCVLGMVVRREREIREFCNQKLAAYKWVRQVKFVEALPKTISGKIRRHTLRVP